MENFKLFVRDLERKISKTLPGEQAQLKMAPITRAHLMRQGVDMKNARKAAVLILLYPDQDIQTVLIQRQDYDGIHSNQISFPGGQSESSDTSMQHTAIRETFEEIGVPEEDVRVLGNLTELYIPPSNFLVLPVIGFMDYKPIFKPDFTEVKKIITVSLDTLGAKETLQEKEIQTSYQSKIKVPCFMVDGHVIWGATAMMVSELMALVNS
ncbi:MAG: CoA pyrophosphatase [Bacteroidota bacterium]|nr:CoA pyrophosphatase [Bacteroidota bacterium]